MAFGIPKKQNKLIDVIFGGIEVERVPNTKYLGVTLSEKLTKKGHLANRRQKHIRSPSQA